MHNVSLGGFVPDVPVRIDVVLIRECVVDMSLGPKHHLHRVMEGRV